MSVAMYLEYTLGIFASCIFKQQYYCVAFYLKHFEIA